MLYGAWPYLSLLAVSGLSAVFSSTGNVYDVLYSRGCVSSFVTFMNVGLMIDTLQSNNWFSEMQKKGAV